MIFTPLTRNLLIAIVAASTGIASPPLSEPAPASGKSDALSDSTALSEAATTPPTELDTMHVNAPKLPGVLGKIFGYDWNVSIATEGANFHIRHGELIDAIGFRHLYLEKHPTERAIVVPVANPLDGHVTQAVVAYTDGNSLHLRSVALGNITALSRSDIDHPEKIRSYLEDIRAGQMTALGSLVRMKGGYDGVAIDRDMGTPTLVTGGQALAVAEETGDYRGVTLMGQPLYPGSAEDMLTSAFYWLNDTAKVGLIPVSRATVKVDLTKMQGPNERTAASVPQDCVVFDWDGIHYFYNDAFGMMGMPLPRDPITGAKCLVLEKGDVLESIYFALTYAKKFPTEAANVIPSVDGLHAAVAYTEKGRLWMFSPVMGRFALPPKYRIGQIEALAQFHAALMAVEMKRLPPGGKSRPETGLQETMPGDSATEQVRRAYLAFQGLGLPVVFAQSPQGFPGLTVTYRGVRFTYFAPSIHPH